MSSDKCSAHRISGGRHDRFQRPPQRACNPEFATYYRNAGSGVSNQNRLGDLFALLTSLPLCYFEWFPVRCLLTLFDKYVG